MTEQVSKTVIVKPDASMVINVWSNFESLPYFMKYIDTVEKTGPRTSHWQVKGPLGIPVDWNAETRRMDENKRIAWNTKDNGGAVTTRP